MKITFYSFCLGDCEDPDIYASEPIWQWQQTEHGTWVMANAHDLTYHTGPDLNGFGFKISIRGEIKDPKKLTEYFLKWPKQAEF